MKALTGKRTEIVVAACRVRTTDPRHPESIVAASQEPFADVADPVQTEHAIRGCIPLVVDVAELLEVVLKDRV